METTGVLRTARAILLMAVTLATQTTLPRSQAQPIRLHPDNPRYFEYKGQPLVLITSGEHYGSVLNLDFDFNRYFETLEADGLNLTRVFTGSYVEQPGAFGIERNTLAPAPDRFLAPWPRTDQGGHGDGGNRFDLTRFNPAYIERMHQFLDAASRHGVIVELVLFSSIYGDEQWAVNPFHPGNNISGLDGATRQAVNTLVDNPALPHQEALVRHLVRELNRHDNLYYEIQNEPWADHHAAGQVMYPYWVDRQAWPNRVEIPTEKAIDWQRHIARVITDEEAKLPGKHLIAQNLANFRLAARPADLAPEVSILNFHYAFPEAVSWNRQFRGVIGCNETGFAGPDEATYRRQAWAFLLSGGGLFNNLDYSFSVGHETGDDHQPSSPGGGGALLRRQLGVLSRFLNRFDLVALRPDHDVVTAAPGAHVHCLSARGHQYAIYLQGRSPVLLTLALPPGSYQAEWLNVLNGRILKTESALSKAGSITLQSPAFDDAIALRIVRAGD